MVLVTHYVVWCPMPMFLTGIEEKGCSRVPLVVSGKAGSLEGYSRLAKYRTKAKFTVSRSLSTMQGKLRVQGQAVRQVAVCQHARCSSYSD